MKLNGKIYHGQVLMYEGDFECNRIENDVISNPKGFDFAPRHSKVKIALNQDVDLKESFNAIIFVNGRWMEGHSKKLSKDSFECKIQITG